MPVPPTLPASLQRYLARRPGATLKKITSEASRRNFYRIDRGGKTLVAMVYPEPSPADVERFLRRAEDLPGARPARAAHRRVLDDQVVLQEDAGDLLLQRAWRLAGRRGRRLLLGRCREMLAGLAAVPAGLATSRLDAARREWEMDFFLSHFFPRFPVRSVGRGRPARPAAPAGRA